ncbi:MAG: hypothetical protein ACYS5V_05455 [Planctomycetota bacterium]|jgi:type II secretory pathway component PulF
MSGTEGHTRKRRSPLGWYVLARMVVTSAAVLVILAGGVLLVPRFEAIYKDMNVELPRLTVLVFDVARTARSAPWAAVPAALAALAAVIVVPLILPRPLGYVASLLMLLGLLAAAAVMAGAVFWPYATMLRSLTDRATPG